MKTKTLITLILTSILASSVYAQSSKRAKEQLGVQLGTDFEFNPLNINGKYQSPTEGLVVVENEKLIGDILDYRKSYNDRIQNTKRNEAQK